MDTLQEKQERLQILRYHCVWFGVHGDVAMQRQLAMECDGLMVEIDQLERNIGQSSEDSKAPNLSCCSSRLTDASLFDKTA